MATIRDQMFGGSADLSTRSDKTAGFKSFMSLQNPEKDAQVLQGQLASLVGTMASFDALGYSLEDLGTVSSTLVEKGVNLSVMRVSH